jgi:hypothetical protein
VPACWHDGGGCRPAAIESTPTARLPSRATRRTRTATDTGRGRVRGRRDCPARRLLCGQPPWAYPLELLLNPPPWTLALLATDAAAWVPGLVACKLALDVSAARMLRGTSLHWRHAVAIPLKDLCYTAGRFAALAVRTVHWRGRTYAIGPGARLLPVTAGDLPASPAGGVAA